MQGLVRICGVKPLKDYLVRLELTDGSIKDVDLEPFLRGPVFELLRRDSNMFDRVRVDPRSGTICWENGANIDPDVLCRGFAPAWKTETPRAKELATCPD